MEQQEEQQNKVPLEVYLKQNPQDKTNLVGFFALLIKVDKRNNPHLYKLDNGSQ